MNTYVLTGAVAQAGYRVVLSGLGADELFGGYGARPNSRGPCVGRATRRGCQPLFAGHSRVGATEGKGGGAHSPGVSVAERLGTLRALWSRKALLSGGWRRRIKWGIRCGSRRPVPGWSMEPPRVAWLQRNTLLRDADMMSMATAWSCVSPPRSSVGGQLPQAPSGAAMCPRAISSQPAPTCFRLRCLPTQAGVPRGAGRMAAGPLREFARAGWRSSPLADF